MARIGPIWLMQPIPYLGEELDENWIYEPKIDGWRIQIIRQPSGETEIWGRRLEKKPDWTNRLTGVVKVAHRFLKKGVILDCELNSSKGRRFIPSLFAKSPKARPAIWVFDIIYNNGEFIGDLSLKERKAILAECRLDEPFFSTPFYSVIDLKVALEQAVNGGHEGIVIKKLDSEYLVGHDGPIATRYWRKIKP